MADLSRPHSPISFPEVEQCKGYREHTVAHHKVVIAPASWVLRYTIWPSSLHDAWWHSRYSLVNTVRTEYWWKTWAHPGRAKQHVLWMSCGCSFAAVVTQCDKLTYVFKSLFPGDVSFCFKCSQSRLLPMAVVCCQCHLALFTLLPALVPDMYCT